MMPSSSILKPEDKPESPFWMRSKVIFGALFMIVFILYGRTLDYPMVFDDLTYLQDNPLFSDPASYRFPLWYSEFVNKPARMGLDSDLAVNFVLRPVAYVSFYLNYLLDGFQPRWYRAVNVVIHAANACLIYSLFATLLRQSRYAASLTEESMRRISIISAILFAVHPVATESVTYIVQRFTSLAAFFFLLALLLQARAWAEPHAKGQLFWKLAALVSVVMGMLTKECTFMAPIMLLLIDKLIIGTHFREVMKRNWLFLLSLPVVPIMVLLVSMTLNDGMMDIQHATNITNNRDLPHSHSAYIITQVTVIAHYLKLIFWPVNLNLDPEWPLFESFSNRRVLQSLVVLLFSFCVAFGLWFRDRSYLRSSLAFLALIWFFLCLIPSSGLVPLPDFVAEHRTYLPSLGLMLIAACLLDRCFDLRVYDRSASPVAGVLVLVLVLVLAGVTWQRNGVWSSRVTLWEDAASKSPGRCRVWNNLGSAYFESGEPYKASAAFRRAIEIEPRFETPYYNLMLVNNHLRQFNDTLAIHDALGRSSKDACSRVNVVFQYAISLVAVGRVQEAIESFHKVAQSDPSHLQAHISLGALYYDRRLFSKALQYWNVAIAIKPPDSTLQRLIQSASEAVKSEVSMP